jgi:hypothetical protein
MSKFLVTAGLVLLALAAPAHAGYCYGYANDPPRSVCGTITLLSPLGYQTPSQRYWVRFCGPSGCRTVQSTREYDFNGTPVEAYIFLNFGDGTGTYHSYDVYVWSDYEYWGSPDSPIDRQSISGFGLRNDALYPPPRPLPPSTIYPASGAYYNITTGYLVQWYSGIDGHRTAWPTTWEVWFKYWGFGQPEPAYFSLSRDNMPCHDDGSGPDYWGNCSTWVADPPPTGNWKWFVRARMDVTSSVPWYMGTTHFITDSGVTSFQVY